MFDHMVTWKRNRFFTRKAITMGKNSEEQISPRTPGKVERKKRMSVLKRISNSFIGLLESIFYKIGWAVGSYPWVTVFLSLLICGLCAIGMKDMEPTNETEKLWVPSDSRVQEEKKWVLEHFPPVTRYASIIFTSANILTPTSLQAIMDVYKMTKELQVDGKNSTTMCFRIGPLCHVTSILELWYYNEQLINSLTEEDILEKVNNVTTSPLYHNDLDVTTLLGSITRHKNGKITGARAASILFLLLDKEEWRDDAMEWELKLVDLVKRGHKGLSNIYIYTTRSFDDEGYGAVNDDITLLSIGFSIVLIYLILTLGRLNALEQRLYLSLAGLGSVGLAIGFAYGLAIAGGVLYGPVHGIMPFLLLGIGVDDMFVIVESWKNLTPEEEKYPLPERMALTLKHAGVSVTVTSITDVVAFAIGASTVIPGLSAFCVYAAIGILALYVLQSTFFVACLALDQRRIEASMDGCIMCYVHKDYQPNTCSQRNIMAIVFEKYLGPNLMKFPVKIFVIIATSAVLGVNIWGFISLRQDFDLAMYIPSDSYAHAYTVAREKYFPSDGEAVNVYCGNLDYHSNMDKLQKLYDDIVQDPYVVNGSVSFWFIPFNRWFESVKHEDWVKPLLDDEGKNIRYRAKFSRLLWKFLYHTREGQAYRHNAHFINGTVIPELQATYFSLRHTNQPNSKAEIIAMESLRKIVDNSGFGKGKCFVYTEVYLTYETNMVLQEELYRNLALAGVCVFIVTLLLIANIRTSLIVFTCVIFTLVDVAGTMHFWGVTIDTASSILLTLSVGLAVDYSAHIGHMFMTVQGTRSERAILTLKKIGPAVFSGGFSTFLAFVLLSRSYSYGFSLFFKVFFTVVVFGLFHGLIYLPVILSWIGPDPYETHLLGDRKHLYIPECKYAKGGSDAHDSQCKLQKDADNFREESSLWVPMNSTRGEVPADDIQTEQQTPLLSKNQTLPNSADHIIPQETILLHQSHRDQSISPLALTGTGEGLQSTPQSGKLESPWEFQGKAGSSVPTFRYSGSDKQWKLRHPSPDINKNCQQEIGNGKTTEGRRNPQIGGNHSRNSPKEEKKKNGKMDSTSPLKMKDTVYTSEGVKLLDKSSKSPTS